MTRILPFNAARLSHPRADIIRDKTEREAREPIKELTLIRDWLIGLGGASALLLHWSALTQTIDTQKANAVLIDQTTPQLRSLFWAERTCRIEGARNAETAEALRVLDAHDEPPQDINLALSYAWRAACYPLSAKTIATSGFCAVLTSSFCLFLPIAAESSGPLTSKLALPFDEGMEIFRQDPFLATAVPEALLLPFIPIHEGRSSRHTDIADKGRRDTQIARLMALLLGSGVTLEPSLD